MGCDEIAAIAKDVTEVDVQEEEALERWAAISQLPASGTAQPQRIKVGGKWRNVYPSHWGITLGQFKELLDKAKADTTRPWSPATSVAELVQNYVIPMTSKKGVGYALLVNSASPKEVNIMVSHAWAENAELFYMRLLRSVLPTDVMFICALALYQCEDGYGPSVLQQLGETAQQSPFRQVLEHIKRKGEKQGWIWRHADFIYSFPYYVFIVAISFIAIFVTIFNCLPHYRRLTIPECLSMTSRFSDGLGEEWVLFFEVVRSDMPQGFEFVVPVFACIGGFGLAFQVLLLWGRRPYAGRMLSCPNRNTDIYSRLWCVYEIFVATQLEVPVELARTLVKAGRFASPSKSALCFSHTDFLRIHKEIEEWGELICQNPQKGYEMVDKAIRKTLHRAKWAVFQTTVKLLWPFSMLTMISTASRHDATTDGRLAIGFGNFASGMVCVCIMGYIALKFHGRLPLLLTVASSGSLLAMGLVGYTVIKLSPQDEDYWWEDGLSEFFLFTLTNGFWFILMLIGSWCLPARARDFPLERSAFLLLTTGILVAAIAYQVVATAVGGPPIILVGASWAPTVVYPIAIWRLTASYGIRIWEFNRGQKRPGSQPGMSGDSLELP